MKERMVSPISPTLWNIKDVGEDRNIITASDVGLEHKQPMNKLKDN